MEFIISVTWLLIWLSIPIIFLLVVSGSILFYLGRAGSIKAGMNKVLDVAVKVWKTDPQPATPIYTIEPRILDPLTQKLKVLGIFKVLSLIGGWNNGHMIMIQHVAAGTDLPEYLDVVANVFARFIRESYGLPAGCYINALVDHDAGRDILSLYCALDDMGAAELDKLRQAKMHRIMPERDILE